MLEFWNFKDSWFLVEQNWIWMVVALVFGIVCGWLTCERRKTSGPTR